MRESIKTSLEPFRVYWRIYGGHKALLRSVYFWAAILITVACYPLWSYRNPEGARPVADNLLSMIPALMAFTLAGMAIILALSGRKFTTSIREGGRSDSLFMKVVVYFFHFILVQSLALITVLLVKSYPSLGFVAALAFLLSTYAISAALSIAAILLNISMIYNVAIDADQEGDESRS